MATSTSQAQQMSLFATRVGTEIKKVYTSIGTLTDLKTTNKDELVKAINEVLSSITSAQTSLTALTTRVTTVEGKASTNATNISTNLSSIKTLQSSLSTAQIDIKNLQTKLNAFSEIDDTKTATDKTYSSSKIASEITAAKQAVKDDLLGGAGAAYDTLKELADLIVANKDSITALQALAAGHVKFDAAQTLTDAQKKQARDNIGAADATTVSDHETRLTAVETKASKNAEDIATLTANVGDTTIDLVAKFEAALEAE